MSLDVHKQNNMRMCEGCNLKVVAPVFCPVCQSTYHPSCAKILDNGGYKT